VREWPVRAQAGVFSVTLQWFDGLPSIYDSTRSTPASSTATRPDPGRHDQFVCWWARLRVVLTNDNSTGNDQVIAAEGIKAAWPISKGKSSPARKARSTILKNPLPWLPLPVPLKARPGLQAAD